MENRVKATYSTDSKATNKNALPDVYVKALRWASDRIGTDEEGVVALITNNSFIDDISFDGVRKHLQSDFSRIYHINLKGNARTSGELRKREAGNIFGDQIRVGIGISFLLKKKPKNSEAEIYIYSVNDYLKSKEKLEFIRESEEYSDISFKRIIPDKNYTWLTEGLIQNFDMFLPMGTKEAKTGKNNYTIFKIYGRGVATCRDSWAYNFSKAILTENINKTVEVYNSHVLKWNSTPQKPKVDDFVAYDETKISWSRDLKLDLQRGKLAEFKYSKIRKAFYRPFTKSYLFFDRILNEEVYQLPKIFPTQTTETENLIIWLTIGRKVPMFALVTNQIVDLLPQGGSQCFPFYIYDEDGSNRQENITDWVLEQFGAYYNDSKISKWHIFHYVYAVLHHPQYHTTYEANLKRELPRMPFTPDFWGFAHAGKQLAQLHVHYEEQEDILWKCLKTLASALDWRVERMRLSRDKTQILYNDFLTLAGIPPSTFTYRLGHWSALDWIIDQYQVKTDKRSGLVNNPNRADNPQYIVRLIGKVITVSLETMKIVKGLPLLG